MMFYKLYFNIDDENDLFILIFTARAGYIGPEIVCKTNSRPNSYHLPAVLILLYNWNTG